MPEHKNAVLDEDGLRKEEVFRRATFNWAISTKKLVEASAGLGNSTKVTRAALADVEYARDLLDGLFLPSTVRGTAASSAQEDKAMINASEVRKSVSDFINRISSQGLIVLPPQLDIKIVDSRRGIDLSAPVHSKNGKMLWADNDCPACPSKAHERCRRPDGGFIEKPHKQRLAANQKAK